MDRKLVRKSNYLIEASYRHSAIEQKIILVLASMIRPDDREFKPYPIKLQSVIQFIGLQTNNDYGYLKEATKNLLGKVITITTPNSELQTHWFSSIEYFEGRGEMEFTFDPKLKPFLLQLKDRFTTYRLREAVQLKSSFSIRILELLRQYEKLGERTFEISRLRELLGIGEDQYRLYADFKKRVILSAQKELASKTNITFDFEEIKAGHAVDKLRFIIRVTAPEPAFDEADATITPTEDPDLEKLIALLPEVYRQQTGIRKLVAEALAKSGVDLVARNIIYANERSSAVNPGSASGKPGNYRNYLAKALREDYGLAFQEDREVHQATQENARKTREAVETRSRQEQEAAQRDQENRERARVYRQNLAPEALASLREEAMTRLDPTHRDLVTRRSPGAEILLKLTMDKICLERMKLA